jgi:tetratricopeptide (TPR) repeat protein
LRRKRLRDKHLRGPEPRNSSCRQPAVLIVADQVDLARLAALVAEGLDPNRYGREQVADLRARALIELGNAYRANDCLAEARATLGEAVEWIQRGSSEPSIQARFSDVHASLLGDSRQFEAAVETLEAVYRARLQEGDLHLAGRALIKKGLFLEYQCRTEEAIPVVRKGLSLIDGEKDPDLLFIGTHNLALCLVGLGRYRAARALVWENMQRFQEVLGRISKLKLRWLRGRIDLGLGEMDTAREAFLEAKQGFRERGLRFKEALVTLDLAVLSCAGGWSQEAQAYSTEAVQVFQSLQIGPETRAAIIVFEFALRHEVAPVALLTSIVEFLRHAEANPHLSLEDWLKP